MIGPNVTAWLLRIVVASALDAWNDNRLSLDHAASLGDLLIAADDAERDAEVSKPRGITFTTAGAPEIEPCPDGATLELHGTDANGSPAVDAHACVGGHGKHEKHRLTSGHEWGGQ